MKNDCLFCGIIHDEIPSFKVYEDSMFLVILDRFPRTEGHLLIMPKKHASDIFTLPNEAARELMPLAQRLAAKMYGELKFDGLNLLQNNGEAAGQQVRHFHLHLIPRYDSDSVVIQGKPVDLTEEELTIMAERLRIG
jgi:histidine triad (HIT) family protein